MESRTSKRFTKVNIEISNICNLQCSFCPEVIRTKKLMSLDLFHKIIQQVAPLTEQVCLHLMGDPLVHPNLEEMVAICAEFNVKIFFVTNGLLMREKQTELLLHPSFRQVNFSLHSFPDNFPDRDPSDYLKRIFNYTDLAMRQRPDLYINYRLWNLQDVRSTSNKNLDILKQIENHFEVTVNSDVDVRQKKSVRLKNRLYLHFDTEFIWPSMDLPVLGTSGRCHGLSSHFGILVDGRVVPCCLDKEAAITLGSAEDKPLLEILDSSRAQAILNGFKNKKLLEGLCQRCNYIERFKPLTIAPSAPAIGISDPTSITF
jgi:radical SAM protein with 4Fe4S-binding SPASM domain